MSPSLAWRREAVRFLPLILLLAIVSAWPLVMLVVGTLRSAPPGFAGSWTLAAWSATYHDPGTLKALRDALLVALVSTAGATLLAAALAFVSERSDLPLRRLITPSMLVVFATPALFYAMGYGFLANPYSGQLNALLHWTLGDLAPRLNIETWAGVITVMLLKKTAIIYLFLVAPFRNLDPSHDEASQLAGAGVSQTFLRINLPALAPALTVAILIGIVGGLQAYDMVLILGGPIGLDVISTRIMDYVNSGVPSDYARASVLSLSIVAVLVLLCLAQTRILGRRSYVSVGGKRGAARRVRLRRARWPLAVTSWLALALIALLPVGAVLFASLQPFPGIYQSLSLDHYQDVLRLPRVLDAIGVTFSLAILVGILSMFLALFIAQQGRALRGWRSTSLRFMTLVPLAMPGVVIALAILWGFVSVPLLRQLYGSLWLLVAALTICSLPLAIQVTSSALAQLSPDLGEAARICGASPRRVFFDILLCLLAPAFLAGWFMVAVLVSGNLEVPMLLKAPGLSPVAMVVYNINASGDFSGSAALLVVLLLSKLALCVTGLGLLHFGRYTLRWNTRRQLASLASVQEHFA
ncbi:ABC transporter permease [Pseudomonas sp. LRF_L74]|uniref:ABC transporter permease n=1 Tax=Pseudomonas sp. LRF_L74 TaxID=3369422 RepID=UPI003F5F79BF